MTTTQPCRDPFAGRARTPQEHFRLLFWGGVLHVRRLLGEVDVTQLPFLSRYLDELAGTGLELLPPAEAAARWQDELAAWEAGAADRLPLRDLRLAAELDAYDLQVWFTVGLVEEDPRFGLLVEGLAGVPGQHRPTAGLLGGDHEALRARTRAAVGRLAAVGLVEPGEGTAPAEPGLRPVPLVWRAARGEPPGGPVRLLPPADLPAPGSIVLEHEIAARWEWLRGLAAPDLAVVVRGPEASGRRTLLRALARAWGRGTLELEVGADLPHQQLGPLSTLLGAVPVLALDPPPGRAADLPRLPATCGPVGVTLPVTASIGDDAGLTAVTVTLGVPGRETRVRHWADALGPAGPDVIEAAAAQRMGAGAIRRVARLATAGARLAGRPAPSTADVADAARLHRSARLDALAVRMPPARGWGELTVDAGTYAELRLLERRCRLREELDAALVDTPARPGTGVRALFTGASGTGKTLAARCLAGALGKDLYRLDLARVVDKYLGETEKNLDRVLRHAAALDVLLLVDEGDALLGRRTDVRSSNDRYANLETDYLLQRLEAHDGIVVVTTNAEQRIDEAFARRLDVVVPFPAPGPPERYAVWRAHLPGADAVDPAFLTEVAARCVLTGGQIRNAVLYACLLALDGDTARVTTADLEAAVRREYVKAGAVCPLRDPVADRP